MEAERKIFHSFLAMHAHKASTTKEPIAHLQFCDATYGSADAGSTATIPHGAPLIALTRDQVMIELDASSDLVRWLLQQMNTYDPTTQRIVGLVFDRRTVLSEVLRRHP